MQNRKLLIFSAYATVVNGGGDSWLIISRLAQWGRKDFFI